MSWQIRVPQGESRGINGAPPPPPPPPPLVYTAGSNRQIEDQCKSMETTLEIRVWINGRACPTWSRDYITPIGNASRPGTEDLPRPKLSHFWRSPPWRFTVSSSTFRVLDIRPIQLRSSPIKFRSFDSDPLPSSCNFIIIIIIVGEASIPNFYFRWRRRIARSRSMEIFCILRYDVLYIKMV